MKLLAIALLFIFSSSQTTTEEQDFLASISLQISKSDPLEIFNSLKTSLVKNIENLNKDYASEDCLLVSDQNKLSNLKEEFNSLQVKKAKILNSLQPLQFEISQTENEYSAMNSRKDTFSGVLQAEIKYFAEEKVLLLKALEECTTAIRGTSGDSSMVFLEIEPISDSLKLLTRVKRSIQKSIEFAEEIEKESSEKGKKLLRSIEKDIEEIAEEIEEKKDLLEQMSGSIQDIEKEISGKQGEIEKSSEIYERKSEMCKDKKEQYDAEVERKEKELGILEKIVNEYEKDAKSAIGALAQGKLP